MPRQRKKYGINVKNPLSLPVSVRIKSKAGALDQGNGYETWRKIRPGDTIYIPLKASVQVEVDVHIDRYDETGQCHKLGDGGWEQVDHKDLVLQVEAKPIVLTGSWQGSNGQGAASSKRWHVIVVWKVPPDHVGDLKRVSFDLSPMEPGAGARCMLKYPGYQQVFPQSGHVSFNGKAAIHGGQEVKVYGRSIDGGIVDVTATITGEEWPLVRKPRVTRVPEHITEGKPKQEVGEPIRSLGEMIEEMKKEEVPV